MHSSIADLNIWESPPGETKTETIAKSKDAYVEQNVIIMRYSLSMKTFKDDLKL